MYSHKSWSCPYFGWDEKRKDGTYRIHCDGCRLQMPDKTAYDLYAKDFCASAAGWKACPVAVQLQKFYEERRHEKD